MFSVDEGPSVRPWIYLCLPGVHPCAACGCLESNVRRFCTASTGRGKCIGRTWRFGAIVWASSRYHRSIAKACVPESMPWFTNEGQEMKIQFFKKRLRSKFKFRFPRKNNLRLYTFRIPHNEVFPYTFKLRVWSSGPYGGNDDRGRPRYRGRVCLPVTPSAPHNDALATAQCPPLGRAQHGCFSISRCAHRGFRTHGRRRPRPCHGPKGHLKRRTAVVGVPCAWRGRRGRPRPPDSKLKPTHSLEEVNRRVSNVHLYVNVCVLSFFKSTFSGLSYLWSWQLCCPLNGSFVSATVEHNTERNVEHNT